MSRRPEHKQLRPATSLAHQLRDQASRSEAPLGIAFALWVCCLPVVAVVALVFFDLSAALPLAAVTLIAWMALCLWAFRTPAAR